ncbi:hypothetical protein EIP86_008927 [Pleurotus ostreatoroseus]|nr:hypothetical protein EIP86_008927 [Pleurotus ostreatoroseus]
MVGLLLFSEAALTEFMETGTLECAAHVLGVPGAVFNVFATWEEAEGAWAHAQAENFIRIVDA